MAGGRPTKYHKKYCQIILDIMKGGGSVVACCAEIGIHKDTFYSWVKEHEEFSDSYKLGMVYAETWWENIGRNGVLNLDIESGDGKTGRVHPGMYSFFMKNRFKWTDRVEQVVETTNTEFDVASMSPEERKQIIADYLQKTNEP